MSNSDLVQEGVFLITSIDLNLMIQLSPKRQEALVNSIISYDDKIKTRLPGQSGRRLSSVIDNFSNFLNLVSVSAMVIAGIGISNTLLSFVNQSNTSIAVKKSIGFSSSFIQIMYFYEIMLILVLTSSLLI